ncbi:low affinity iron permease family protein [Acidisoma silvae]|uniref:Low affinity iron permease family protein n=1 Tax=Acidisoma silvae TaxID=2802396 RepID=A0A963YTV8_9PROT|nr:low affinity iron permease family protein [Acidisoma silvae]MCB8876943.1 low affinity iron permease family protein [Acidisoma silvae]
MTEPAIAMTLEAPHARKVKPDKEKAMEVLFSRFAQKTGVLLGRPLTFVTACLVIIVWGVTGPLFHYSDTWQLVVNTGTSVITFLMVFLLQHGQNRDTRMIQIKLDELIRANETARNALLGLEDLSDADMRLIQARFAALSKAVALPEELDEVEEDLGKATANLRNARRRIADTLSTDP